MDPPRPDSRFGRRVGLAGPEPDAVAVAVRDPQPHDRGGNRVTARGQRTSAGTERVTLDAEQAIDASGLVVRRFTVRWEAPSTPGVTVRVFGVTRCLNRPTSTGVPCVVDGMKLPAAARTLVARGPAADGAASWTWPLADVDGPVLAWTASAPTTRSWSLRSTMQAVRRSPFVVVESAVACSDCMS